MARSEFLKFPGRHHSCQDTIDFILMVNCHILYVGVDAGWKGGKISHVDRKKASWYNKYKQYRGIPTTIRDGHVSTLFVQNLTERRDTGYGPKRRCYEAVYEG